MTVLFDVLRAIGINLLLWGIYYRYEAWGVSYKSIEEEYRLKMYSWLYMIASFACFIIPSIILRIQNGGY